MNKFIRIGEKLSKINICGNNICEYGIFFHSANSPKTPATTVNSIVGEPIEKSATILQNYICKITGISIPVLYDCYPLKTNFEILVGGTSRDYDTTYKKEYRDDDYDIIVKDGLVIINGGKRGVLYGVYSFIEKCLGVRFITKDVEKIIDNDCIEINNFEDKQRPVFEYRDICDCGVYDAEFSVKSKVNGSFVRKLHVDDGGSIGFAGGSDGLVHTFLRLVPPNIYYKDKKYLYAFDNGVRNPGGLCMSEEETLDVVVKSAIEWLDKEESPTLVSVSINDGEMAYCHCKKCEEKRNKGWNDTDILIDFVNRVQRKIKVKYPKVAVDTISYHGTDTPPNIVVPDKDVVIRVCSTGVNSLSYPEVIKKYEKERIHELDSSMAFVNRLKKYSEITDKIYVWDYPYCYFQINCPFPILGKLLDNARFYADNNAKGVFINGNGTVATCDFSELKVYLLAKILFNPYMTEQEYNLHYDEFLQCYYGDGWKYVKDYIKLCEELSGEYYNSFSDPLDIILEKNSTKYITLGRNLLEKAYALSLQEGEKRNIYKHILQIEYYDIYCFFDKVMENGTTEQKEDYILRNEKLYNDLRSLGVTRVLENAFLPVVKNFHQSIKECSFWNDKAATGDRNNENYERDVYVVIPIDANMGEKVDISFLYQTNNENDNGFLGVWNGKEIIDSNINPTWNEYRDLKEISLSGGIITNVDEFSEKTGIALSNMRLNLIPRHHKGIVLRIKKMNAGAYLFVVEPKII